MYYTEVTNSKKQNADKKELHELVLFLKFIKQKRWLFFLAVLVCSIIVYALTYDSLTFTSKITLYTSENSTSNIITSGTQIERDVNRLVQPSTKFSQIYSIVYSQKMLDHLITKFNLYHHYGIKPADEFAKQKARQIIKGRITVRQEFEGIFSIIVKDNNNNILACDIANELALKAKDLSLEIQVASLQNSIKVYNSLYDEIRNTTVNDTKEINAAIASLHELIESVRTLNIRNYAHINNTLSGLTERINQDYENLTELNKIRGYALKAIDDTKLPTFFILGEALSDSYTYGDSYKTKVLITGLKSLLAGALISLVVFFFYFEAKILIARYSDTNPIDN